MTVESDAVALGHRRACPDQAAPMALVAELKALKAQYAAAAGEPYRRAASWSVAVQNPHQIALP